MEMVRSQDGTHIAYDRIGSGRPIVLVSGASTARAVHEPLAGILSADFTVFNYDRRGRGDSGDTLPYAVEREIEDLAAVIHVAGGRASVFGNSSGAVLALRAAAAGLPITRLALWEPPFIEDADAPRRQQAYVAKLNDLLSAGHRGDAAAMFLSTIGMPQQAISGIRQSPGWAGMEAIAPTLAYDAAVMGDSRLPRDLLSSVTVPTLILTGANTGAWADTAGRALTMTMPSSEHRVLKGQTHAVAWDVLAIELRPFFDRDGG